MVHHGRSFSSIYESQPAIFYLDGLGIWLIDKEVWSRTCPPPLQRTAWLFFRRCKQPMYKIFLQLMEANKCICVTISFFGHHWLLCYVVVYSKGASLLFIATDLQPLSCELWMSYQAGSKKWQINRKPECVHRHFLPFTCIFSKPLACRMIPYSIISYLGLLGNRTAIKWRTYMSNSQATIFS